MKEARACPVLAAVGFIIYPLKNMYEPISEAG